MVAGLAAPRAAVPLEELGVQLSFRVPTKLIVLKRPAFNVFGENLPVRRVFSTSREEEALPGRVSL